MAQVKNIQFRGKTKKDSLGKIYKDFYFKRCQGNCILTFNKTCTLILCCPIRYIFSYIVILRFYLLFFDKLKKLYS